MLQPPDLLLRRMELRHQIMWSSLLIVRRCTLHRCHYSQGVFHVRALEPPGRIASIFLLRECQLVVELPPAGDDTVRVVSKQRPVQHVHMAVVSTARGGQADIAGRQATHSIAGIVIDPAFNAASVRACSASEALSSSARAAVIVLLAARKLLCTAPKTARLAQAATGACSGGTSLHPDELLYVAGRSFIPQGNGA